MVSVANFWVISTGCSGEFNVAFKILKNTILKILKGKHFEHFNYIFPCGLFVP